MSIQRQISQLLLAALLLLLTACASQAQSRTSSNTEAELDQMLARTARNQENDLGAQVALLVGLFEPFMLVFMGAVVLVIVLAILLPILSLNQLVG